MERAPHDAGSQAKRPLPGLRVLVVEDEVLIAMLIEEALEDLGCEPIGPHRSLSSALSAADAGGYDVALIDFNLAGEPATPLAARLVELGKPFAIASGGGPGSSGHGETSQLRKPFKVEEVETVLRTLAARERP